MADNNNANEKICPGDCLQCTRVQQLYCASQGSLELRRSVEALSETVKSLTEKVDQLLASEEDKPSQVKKGKAPKSSGADNRS